MTHFRTICTLLLLLAAFGGQAQSKAGATFTNPLLPAGADPWCIYKDGFYYYTHTTGRNITLWKTKTISDLPTAEKKVVFTPPATGAYSKELWAPEIHFLRGKWYIYFAADSGRNEDHRLWVLENSSADPLKGEWIVKGKLTTPDDKWAIDGSVYEHKGKLYLVWSGWQGDVNGQQDIFIAAMSNPWTVTGERIKISSPTLSWETHGDLGNPNDVSHVNVNEGPQILEHKGRLFLVYSASGCWTDYYSLGLMALKPGGDLLDPAAWVKAPEPVFTQNKENEVYAPGHNSFFMSPNGKEYWILYHANDKPGQGCGGHRSPRAQQFTWKADGTPDFGLPLRTKQPLAVPGEKKKK
ncbi:MAG: glycoside hydrolase family 43 protein [Candidatus Pseudobacter hemicellulosilyticus]|uniref:Glycoside hydrolase family 43 protein n=1 Tax=Candidatus Pseudobacter hemicellulosilyticus TaxID=3121375 RepID=A0AAJ5WW52_9BACT|nr:MAG: glycoside hydrolase family 43 protein [Pseudobacter sp.]